MATTIFKIYAKGFIMHPETPKLIGLAGLSGSGKTTAAEFLENIGYTPLTFADPLRALLSASFGIDYECFDLPELKDTDFAIPMYLSDKMVSDFNHYLANILETVGVERSVEEISDTNYMMLRKVFDSPRHMMQYFGTDIIRERIHASLWLELAEAQIRDTKDNVVITDVRFPNEVALVKQYLGTMILLERPSINRDGKRHTSEIIDFNYDVKVVNDGTIENLSAKLLKLV